MPSTATVDVRSRASDWSCVVEDDGDRVRPAGRQRDRADGHFGLASCASAPAAGGGECEVGPRPGGGTRVVLRMPVALMDVGAGLDALRARAGARISRSSSRTGARSIPALASFYGLGARRNGWLFHRSLPGRADADRAALAAAGLDVATLEAADRLVVAEPPLETEPDTWALRWVPMLERALARGFDAAWFSRYPIRLTEARIELRLGVRPRVGRRLPRPAGRLPLRLHRRGRGRGGARPPHRRPCADP